MANIDGISTIKNAKGEITHVTIDIQKHQELIPLLQKMGALERPDFEKECERALSVEESLQRSLNFIDTLPWKK